MAPKKSDKVSKLVPLKVPYEELRPFRRELSKLRLDFLLWNLNCVSASICKEIMDKNTTEGVELRDEVSDSSVEKTVAPIVSTSEVAVGESTQAVEMEGPSGVLIEVPADAPAEPLKEGMKIVSPNSLSSERTWSTGSEEIPHPKMSEELVKELTLSDEILEQVVAQVEGTVEDAADIALPSSPVEDVRPEGETKTLKEEPKELVVSFPNFLQDSVVPLLKYLDMKREKYDVSKEAGIICAVSKE
ncbi:hypothetical protein AXG93_4874s1280 [Marchantia polymorpha subsp. ruderalis]|uniref:Uncharacterized protein n=1 Tax=Marchantia polymorpha subsp. ruderalis TaxID=1480154 RepID=A0A176WGM1_MARPO|nr:hypothetical protein AXG93_4874s1280 [Marchantia polymorpha subsp. ruderalis]